MTAPKSPIFVQYSRSAAQAALGFSDISPEFLTEMTRRGITEKKARELLTHLRPGQELMDQLEYVDFLVAKDRRGKLENPPGLYVFYVRDNIAPPADFCSSRVKRLQEQALQKKNAVLAQNAQLEIDYEQYRFAEIDRFADSLPAPEYQKLFEMQRRSHRDAFRLMSPEQLDEMTHVIVRRELAASGRVHLMCFDEFMKGVSVQRCPETVAHPEIADDEQRHSGE